MRRFSLFVAVVCLTIASMAAVPAKATEAPVGTRVNIVAGTPTALPADTPFHVLHGWGVTTNQTTGVGVADIRLDINGVDQGRGSLQNTGAAGGGAVSKLWLYSFEDGLLAGTYVLTGHWFLPCRPAVAAGLYAGPCKTPNTPVEVFNIPLTVTFS